MMSDDSIFYDRFRKSLDIFPAWINFLTGDKRVAFQEGGGVNRFDTWPTTDEDRLNGCRSVCPQRSGYANSRIRFSGFYSMILGVGLSILLRDVLVEGAENLSRTIDFVIWINYVNFLFRLNRIVLGASSILSYPFFFAH